MQITEQITRFITTELVDPSQELELAPDDDLLTVGMLDSIEFMRLVQFIEIEHAIKVPPEDLVLENFQTIDQITAYLGSRLGNSG